MMGIERFDPVSDKAEFRACYETYVAAHWADDPELPPMSPDLFRGWLTVGWNGEPRETWMAAGKQAGGSATEQAGGYYMLKLPDRENLDRGQLILEVNPAVRRRGVGSALLEHAVGRAAADGRAVLNSEVWADSAGEAFARAAGATPGLVEIRRVLELGKIPEGRLAELRRPAARAAAGYSLVSWTGPMPEEFIEHAAALFTALDDAPSDPGVQRREWDAQRVRESVVDLFPCFGTREYAVAAQHDATGELAALTQVGVDPPHPELGYQEITAVTREHRGHRLGLLVKIEMLELLAAAEPQLERISTWNAESNRHMISVNEALGCEILGPPARSWELSCLALDRLPR